MSFFSWFVGWTGTNSFILRLSLLKGMERFIIGTTPSRLARIGWEFNQERALLKTFYRRYKNIFIPNSILAVNEVYIYGFTLSGRGYYALAGILRMRAESTLFTN